MIKLLTPIVVAVIAALSFGLHTVKIDAKESREELRDIRAEISAEQKAIQILSAEWSYLNQPGKLQAMSEKYLKLQSIEVEQIAGLEDITRLSPPLVEAMSVSYASVEVNDVEGEEIESGLVVQASLEVGEGRGDKQ